MLTSSSSTLTIDTLINIDAISIDRRVLYTDATCSCEKMMNNKFGMMMHTAELVCIVWCALHFFKIKFIIAMAHHQRRVQRAN